MEKSREELEQVAYKHNFQVEQVQDLPEMHAKLWRMRYEKNNAQLVWLEREEENKTFAITFKTIPEDDTGVFHIIEHSLLCGSKKYPLRKPFVELIKGSLQTFMNAFTFPDKTMYPICSRNSQDFLNLMDVYLDAVLHPLCVDSKEIFLQEGWHYEMEGLETPLSYNGVVYNEMKGNFASVDSLLDKEMNRSLFPDMCYRFVSGGTPESIPDLTYEKYVESYKKYYHPSNARIFLDGEMDIDVVLEKLDSYLKDFEDQKIESVVPFQEPVKAKETTTFYEVGEQEDVEHKVILAQGYVYGKYNELEKHVACAALAELLCASNDSPIKAALLKKGLAEDVQLVKESSIQQAYMLLIVKNTTIENKALIWETVNETLTNLVKSGLNRKRLGAILNRMEFQAHEKEFGWMPEGVGYAMQALQTWLYSGDPAQNLCEGEVYPSLRNKLESGYFEQLIVDVFLENQHRGAIALLPSKSLAEKKRVREEERLSKIRSQWSEEEKKRTVVEFANLREVQNKVDTREQIALLPKLELKDIPEQIEEIPQQVQMMGENQIIHQQLTCDGILHLSLYFSLADFSLEELSKVSILRTLLGQIGTEHFTMLELQGELQEHLGRFEVSVDTFSKSGETDTCSPYLIIRVSVLEHKKDQVLRLLEEALLYAKFNDLPYLQNKIRQLRMGMEQQILMNGDSYAKQRAQSAFTAQAVAMDNIQGLSMLRFLQRLDKTFGEEGERLVQELNTLRRRILIRNRLSVGVTAESYCDQWMTNLLDIFSDDEEYQPCKMIYPKTNKGKFGIQIPTEIGFASKTWNLYTSESEFNGSFIIAARILSYGYLWDTVRVKGGAYGTRLTITTGGNVDFTSFRDPVPLQSLEVFDGAGSGLLEAIRSREQLERYIISTIASIEPLQNTRMKGVIAEENVLKGFTKKRRQAMRREILHTSYEDLEQVGNILTQTCVDANTCIIAGPHTFEGANQDEWQIEVL